MIRITSTEFGKSVGQYSDTALTEPVVIMRNGRDRTVLLSYAEYSRLKKSDREAFDLDDAQEMNIEPPGASAPSDPFKHEMPV